MRLLLRFISKNHRELVDLLQIAYLIAFILLMFTGRFGAILSAFVFMSMFLVSGNQEDDRREEKRKNSKRNSGNSRMNERRRTA